MVTSEAPMRWSTAIPRKPVSRPGSPFRSATGLVRACQGDTDAVDLSVTRARLTVTES